MSWNPGHVVQVTIDNVDMTQYLISRSLYIRSNVGNDADLASFELRDNNLTLNPYGWDEVTITIDGVTVFGGYIVERSATAIDANSGTHWIIECKDWSLLFDTIQVDKRYSQYESGGVQYAWSDKQIIANLFSTYLSGDGFDAATNVTQQNATANIAFENISLRDALNQLAARMYADWFVAPNKSLYWFNPLSPGNAAFSIDTVSPNFSTSYPSLRASIRRSVDELNIINDVTVIGGYNETRGTQTFTYAANVWDYQLPYKVKSIVQVRLQTTAGYIPLTNGANRLVYAPDGVLTSEGGDGWVRVDLTNSQVTLSSSFTASNMSAGHTIEVDYFYLLPVTATATSAASIATFGRAIKRTYYDENLLTTGAAQEYADALISEYAFGKESVRFDVAEYGLLAGRLITITVPEVDIGGDVLLLQEDTDRLLAENDDNLATEQSLIARTYLIQQVEYRPIPSTGGTYLMVASVQCGAYQNTLIEALQRLGGNGGSLSSGVGSLPAIRYPGQLSNISNGLGEIVAGRMTLTNGGTAPFSWSQFNAHTGVVVGLDDSGTVGVGNFLLLQQGTAKVRIGRLDGLGTVNGLVPSGYGIYTDNGYFRGTVAASLVSGGTVSGGLVTGGSITGNQITGGTITGGRITGGTVSGALVSGGTVSGGQISGGTITGSRVNASTIIGGTVATAGTVNSSNPGVVMTADGLFGYGTIGLTFALYSDPALRPIFSSGTILNTVYEVTTASVLRTGTVNPRVQIDNSGIFAYNSGGTLTTSIDVATGRLTAINGSFSGTVSASTVSGGTVSGGLVSGGTVSGALVSGGTVSGGLVSGGTVSGAVVSGGSIVFANSAGTIDNFGIRFGSGTATEWISWTGGTARTTYISGGSSSIYLWANTTGVSKGYVAIRATDVGQERAYIDLSANGLITLYPNFSSANGTVSIRQTVSMPGTANITNLRPTTTLVGSTSLAAGPSSEMRFDNGTVEFRNTAKLSIQAGITNPILPNVDYSYALGSSSKRWSEIYGGTAILRRIQAHSGGLEVHSSLEPSTNNTFALGNSVSGFSGLYLHDAGAGVVRQLRINNGTVLIS